jgi:ribulose-5-phosphate 4-epimerase/fuculose-1-phosphate aldolase
VSERDLREKMVEHGRSLFDRGLTSGSSGNISIRLPNLADTFFELGTRPRNKRNQDMHAKGSIIRAWSVQTSPPF